MIHYTPEGAYLKLGLNFRFAQGGFLFVWAWYSIARHELITYRFRLRIHISPIFIYTRSRCNVIDAYARANDMELVNREVLYDLKAVEDSIKRRNDQVAYVNRI